MTDREIFFTSFGAANMAAFFMTTTLSSCMDQNRDRNQIR